MTSFSSWNYRVVKQTQSGEDIYGIHEVYYDESGKPSACSESPIDAHGETLEDLVLELDRMRAAAEKPTLNYSDFSHDT